ncbi:hypothetical protein T02_13991 [Trichinella nativa]|uniref:Uncharacterized protein n=1 Tax=Trichinella nativa TaxID=6335 RepID=A0A0V1LN02_9BILA|nr:hypothetical protein T06_16403 [Trichinella sp. T6]KRZ60852.1 hypothetical protein T02_13991 [Trichinella nativa]
MSILCWIACDYISRRVQKRHTSVGIRIIFTGYDGYNVSSDVMCVIQISFPLPCLRAQVFRM